MLIISLLLGAVSGLFDRRVLMSIVVMTAFLLASAFGIARDGNVLDGIGWFFSNLAVFEMALVVVGVVATFLRFGGASQGSSGLSLGQGLTTVSRL
jgi:hypothetical protein